MNLQLLIVTHMNLQLLIVTQTLIFSFWINITKLEVYFPISYIYIYISELSSLTLRNLTHTNINTPSLRQSIEKKKYSIQSRYMYYHHFIKETDTGLFSCSMMQHVCYILFPVQHLFRVLLFVLMFFNQQWCQ